MKLAHHREQILQLAEKHGARHVRVFGSVARGEATDESDLDLLVEMEPGRSLLDRIGLIQDLQDLLGHKVDVVNDKAIHPLIQDRVLREAVALSRPAGSHRMRPARS